MNTTYIRSYQIEGVNGQSGRGKKKVRRRQKRTGYDGKNQCKIRQNPYVL